MAHLGFPLIVYFSVAAYIGLVALIYLNDLLDDIIFLLLINQGSLFSIGRPVGRKLPCMEVVHTT